MKLAKRYDIILLALITLAVYYPTLFAPFNSIDDKLLVTHLINKEGFTWSEHFFPGGRGDYYRPLIMLSYEFDKLAWGLEESFMHLENILLHLLNAVLLYLAACRLNKIFNLSLTWLPFVLAACFALHPVNTEAVNWITSRTDLMATTGVYAALYGLLVYYGTGRILPGVLSAFGLAFGALAKEPALFFLPGALVIIWWSHSKKERLTEYANLTGKILVSTAYAVVVAGYFILRWLAFHSDRGVENTLKVLSTVEPSAAASEALLPMSPVYFKLLLKATGFYFKKIFWPFPLNFATISVAESYLYAGVFVLLLICWLLYRRTLLSGIALSSLFIASSALLVILNPMSWTPVAERYLYMASGLFLMPLLFGLVINREQLFKSTIAVLLVTGLLAASAYGTYSRNIVWQDNVTLFQDAVEKSPNNKSAKNELALALIAAGRQEEGYALLDSIQGIKGQLSSLNQVAVFLRRKQYPEAKRYLLERLEAPGPNQGYILKTLIKTNQFLIEESAGDDELQHGYYMETINWLDRLKKLTNNPFYSYRLGQTYLVLGDKEQAQVNFADAAKRFEATSPYQKPAEKLARDLARQ